MDFTRFVLVICFALVSLKLWTDWEISYGPQRQNASVTTIAGSETVADDEVPGLPDETRQDDMPLITSTATVTADGEDFIEVFTDTFRLKIASRGAGIREAALPDFPTSVDNPEDPFVLMEESIDRTYIAQGGLLSRHPAPTHESQFKSERKTYLLNTNDDLIRVPFFWSEGGIRVEKTYEIQRGSHLITIRYQIKNETSEIWGGRSYAQLKRNDPKQGRMRTVYTYTGAVISSPENRYEKISFDDITEQSLERETQDGWAAMIQHYFVTALVPADKSGVYNYYTRALANNLFVVGAISPAVEIAPGEEAEIVELIYIGPKDQDKLAKIADGLDLTVDYGMLWFIAKPLFWALGEIHQITGNWGWSIVLVTILLKLLFYKLSAAGYRSMANMRRVQPRIVSIRDRYKDDKARLNQAMMQIYKEEKINPLGGCLPILVQIPVFIALYWVLLESVELRQASFIFWLRDLSTPDPYWVLPVIMGITMYVQQKLNPAPIDPIQAKVMSILPFAFTIFFGFFPSGLVLYWVANNTLSIGQQWMIMRNLERAGLGVSRK